MGSMSTGMYAEAQTAVR